MALAIMMRMGTRARRAVAWVSLDNDWLLGNDNWTRFDDNWTWCDDDWAFNNDRLFNCDCRGSVSRRSDCCRMGTCRMSLLHRGDHVVVDALAVHRDDLVNSNFLLDAVSLNLADDYIAAHAILRQRDNVVYRDATRKVSSLLVGLLLLLVGSLLLILVGFVIHAILLLADKSAGDCSYRAADQCSFWSLVILVPDDAADDCTSSSSSDCPAL